MTKLTEQLDSLYQHLLDYCRENGIFVEESSVKTTSCQINSGEYSEGCWHYIPAGITVCKQDPAEDRVIHFAHEIGHFLDLRDNPGGREDGNMCDVFESPDGCEYVISFERYAREAAAWTRGHTVLSKHPNFKAATFKEFKTQRRHHLYQYACAQRQGRRHLIQGKHPFGPPAEHTVEATRKRKEKRLENALRKRH